MSDGIKIPPRYVLFGNRRIASKLANNGGKLLAKLKEDMGFGGLQIGKRTHNFGGNIFIRVSSFFGIDKVEMHALGHGDGYLGHKRPGSLEDPFVENLPEVPGVPGELPGPIDVITQDPSNLGVPGVPGIHSIPGVPGEPAVPPCGLVECGNSAISEWSLGGRTFQSSTSNKDWSNLDNLLSEGPATSVTFTGGSSETSEGVYLGPPANGPFYSGVLDYCYFHPGTCLNGDGTTQPPIPTSSDSGRRRHFNYDDDTLKVSNLLIPINATTVYVDWEIRWNPYDTGTSNKILPLIYFYKVDASTGCIKFASLQSSGNIFPTVTGWQINTGTESYVPGTDQSVLAGPSFSAGASFSPGTMSVDYFKTRLRYDC